MLLSWATLEQKVRTLVSINPTINWC
jgi:hypothetical protein